MTPYVGNNGNWYYGNVDTGIPSKAADEASINEMYGALEIDENGDLYMVTPVGYAGPVFELDDDKNLWVVKDQ